MLRLLSKLLPLVVHELVDYWKARKEAKEVQKRIDESIKKHQNEKN